MTTENILKTKLIKCYFLVSDHSLSMFVIILMFKILRTTNHFKSIILYIRNKISHTKYAQKYNKVLNKLQALAQLKTH